MLNSMLVKEKGMLRLNGIDAGKIMGLLSERHSKDVFVPECKNGETWGARDLQMLDAWVLRRSYSPLTTIGYEVKCSRQDFEQDQKWTGYLDLCHQFYFVCPAGLIRASDLPNRIGIMWASKDKLHIKRKAERINPDIGKLNRLLIYVAMSRTKIVANMNEIYSEPQKNRLQQLKEAVELADTKKELAYFVKGHIKGVAERLTKQEANFKYREDMVKRFEEHLKLLGIIWDSNNYNWQDTMRIDNEIDLLKKRIDNWTLSQMREIGKKLTEVSETIGKLYSREGSK